MSTATAEQNTNMEETKKNILMQSTNVYGYHISNIIILLLVLLLIYVLYTYNEHKTVSVNPNLLETSSQPGSIATPMAVTNA
jgi:short subunit fatty acids transporter